MAGLQKCLDWRRIILSDVYRINYLRRCVHSSQVLNKRRKTREEKKMPKAIVYSPKSKWKSNETVDVWKNMTIGEVAKTIGKDVDHVLEVMNFIDDAVQYRKVNDVIDNFKVIEEIVKKSGFRWKITGKLIGTEEEDGNLLENDVTKRDPSTYVDTKPRPPVVAIMGHVDHGKTTLLDYLRNSSIVAQEFGGITQHIGAFSVKVGKDRVTFLDTPGHAAFMSMRSRGAHSTDIVVLVVAADDGVMEQTLESINLAKEANVPIIVAINKIDKPQANVDRAKKMLGQYGILVEDLGGDVQAVPISALKGTNVDTLVDAILVQSELMELKSDFAGPAEGVVIESLTDTHRGKLCTLLVQCGTLKKGAVLIAGTSICRVRGMFDDQGQPVPEGTPSSPVQTLGWKELPSAGEIALQVKNEKEASRIVHFRQQRQYEKKAEEDIVAIDKKTKEHYQAYREQLETKRKLGRYHLKHKGPREKEIKDVDCGPRLDVIIKGDVDGSVEAILDVLETYDNPKCSLHLVHYGVGPVSKNDFTLAESFDAIIYSFNTKLLEEPTKKVIVKQHNVIYRLMDDIKAEINKRLPLLDAEEIVGEANVLQEFMINEGRQKVPIAGCRCLKGSLKKAYKFRLVRRGEVIYDGDLSSLRHLKDEVDTVKKDLECGVKLSDETVRFLPGDTLICYKINKVPDCIEWNPGF